MKTLRIFLLFLLVFAATAGRASHLVGGEFEINYRGNFEYDIKLNVYADNAGLTTGNQDGSVNVSIFVKGTNQFVETFTMYLGPTAFVPYVNQQCQQGSVQTKILTYQLTRQLPPQIYNNPNGYYIVWERCCRNQGIFNIQNPEISGFVYYAEFPPVVKNNQEFVNSLPVLPPMPPDLLCAGQLYSYSLAATDADGDQLVYKLSNPMRGYTNRDNPFTTNQPGPYPIINWRPPFDLNNQISGSPRLTINAQTGLLTVGPNLTGLFVFAITVEEYRNGVKIGEVRRDIQIKISACQFNNKPTITLRQPGATRDYQPGDTLFVTDATDYCYTLKFSDQDLGQVLTLKAVPLNFNLPPTITPSSGTIVQAGQVLTAKICWSDCDLNSPDKLYKVNLIVTDNPCGQPAADTLQLSFLVIPKPNVKPEINTLDVVNGEVSGTIGNPVTFNLVSTDADKDFMNIRMSGTGFIPSAEGMKLTPFSGTEAFRSTFTWTPTCDQLAKRSVYDVHFVVLDNSCFPKHTDTVSVRIKIMDVKDETVFLPPNIFTPNNDNRNDLYTVPSLPLDKCDDTFQEIRIYNRWGVQVFKSADRQFAWNGKNVSDGVYYYAIKFQKRTYKGYINIVR